jgi:ribosomal protein S12
MSELNFKPQAGELQTGDKLIGVPMLDDAASTAAAASARRAWRSRSTTVSVRSGFTDPKEPNSALRLCRRPCPKGRRS